MDEWNEDWNCTKDRKILDRSEVGGTSVDNVCKQKEYGVRYSLKITKKTPVKKALP